MTIKPKARVMQFKTWVSQSLIEFTGHWITCFMSCAYQVKITGVRKPHIMFIMTQNGRCIVGGTISWNLSRKLGMSDIIVNNALKLVVKTCQEPQMVVIV